MRRSIKLLFLALTLSACTFGDVVEVESQEIDMGKLCPEDSLAQAVIRLTNHGRKDLFITNVKTDCACVVVAFSRSHIAPGKTTELPVTIDISRYAPQLLEHTIGIYTNLVDTPIVVNTKVEIGYSKN